MKKIRKTKNIHEDLIRRNQKEKERVLKSLEAEKITEKSAAEVLSIFSQTGFPTTMEEILRILAPLHAQYGLPKIVSNVYPTPPVPIPSGWQKSGMRWALEFSNGQSVSVVIANDGKTVIKRFYEDNGDVHTGDVIKALRAWQKNVEQKQHGGRKNDPELYGLFQKWQRLNFAPDKKKVFRQQYLDNHSNNPFADADFNNAMKRYKRKQMGSKSLKSD